MADAAQYQELVKLYGTFGDGELMELGQGMGDLTEMAQQALKGELARRGLQVSETREPEPEPGMSDDEMERLRAYAELAPPECVFEFADEQGASTALRALTAEGIEAVALVGEGAGFEGRGPRVVVAPEDAGRAEALLSQPLVERFRNAEEIPPEFDLPVCPECGGEETLLEAVDPVNHWRCDGCGHSWVEGSGGSVQ
ncbi:MAG: hypothetical protein M3Y50_04070 [Acidobacteriota bacterium]|nr:hypothetical protein [Acidobacteriota bacterium]